ncbi:hypothetical protein GVO57_14445 (plasmid) [Sphingomonas changnyeongensis]|uniref:Uncharacterized protein n=1 Tax=Sphingomonas changnyeongensis TaxID=2698679 RepID=A0A7Z2NZF1_9SPHN|nr:hypothetical protein [Sphingomonas changnyeongensis]QHL92074.1 hypothetical protein GVO57_14445 [Sphingomonas changnyeongensis]
MCTNQTIPQIGTRDNLINLTTAEIRENLTVVADILGLRGQALAACYVSMAVDQLNRRDILAAESDSAVAK